MLPLIRLREISDHLSRATDPIAAFRAELQEGDRRQRDGFQAGDEVESLVAERVQRIDLLLTAAWTRFFGASDRCALVAVGGYGRGELHPYSDIDLLILLESPAEEDAEMAARVTDFTTFLWDIFPHPATSVRTVEQCVEAAADITVITNLLESRPLCGNPALFQRMREATAPGRIWPSDAFFSAKKEEQRLRHLRYGDSAYRLEPNVKESPGGLRDLQTIAWVAKRHFGATTLHDLVLQGFLTEREYEVLSDCQHFLWRVRFGLHVLTKRPEDRLLFDLQRTLADHFGYPTGDKGLAVEQFMQDYYRTVKLLIQLNERLLQLFDEAILLNGGEDSIVSINHRFQARNGFIEVKRERVFQDYPFALLEVFLLLEQHPELKGIRASTLRLIRTNRSRINDRFRADIRARSLFMEIFRQPSGLTHTLRRMNRYGILAEYLPEFRNIVGRMQYDLFHVFTVDEHTLFVVRNLRRFTFAQHAREFPLCHEIVQGIPKPELLYLGGLFHDIGKGRGGDHSKLGAEDARAFCKRHDLSDYDANLVAWLVETHLRLSMTAQRMDIKDPEVIHRFATEMGTLERLDYLYLLTVADVHATDPAKWNTWKDSILRELYHATRRALLRGLQNPEPAAELIRDRQREALERLAEAIPEEAADLPLRSRLEAHWASLSPEYFLRFSADEIAWHARRILAGDPLSHPIVELRRESERGGSEVFLVCADRDDLFALTASLLSQAQLNILDARIETAGEGLTLASYTVSERDGGPIWSELREEEALAPLRYALSRPGDIQLRPAKVAIPRRLEAFKVATSVEFCDPPSRRHTILRLVTTDRPGLLASVGEIFSAEKLRVHSAKIATIGAEADDAFFITDRANHPITDPAWRNRLQRLLIDKLDVKSA